MVIHSRAFPLESLLVRRLLVPMAIAVASAVSLPAPASPTPRQDGPIFTDLAPEVRIDLLRRQLSELRAVVILKQAEWDKLHGEYQRMLANSGGRMNRVGQAKVAKLDAEARGVKAEIELAETRIAELEELLEEAEEELAAPRRDSSGGAGRERGFNDGAPAHAQDMQQVEKPVAARELEWVARFAPVLSDRHFIFDEWDPVGGLGPSFARVTRRGYRKQFGALSLTKESYIEDILYLSDGRRVLREETHRFGQSLLGDWDGAPELERDAWQFESARGELVELRKATRHYEVTEEFIPPRDPDLGEYGVQMVARLADLGETIECRFYDGRGDEKGMSITEYERVGEYRRPRRQLHRGRCVHSFRAFLPDSRESTSPEPHRIFEWGYGADGRVASVRMTRMRSEEPLPLGELVIALADSDTRDGLDHVIATLLRDETVMSYSFDEIGRLRAIRSVRRQYSVDPLTELRVAAAVDSTTDAGSRAFFLELGAEATRRGPTNQPLDGDFIDVIESDIWRTTTTLEMRVESWDARGRWTRAVTYAQDEAGEIAAYESVRRFTDLSLSAEPVHGEFQFMPRSATPGLGQISSLEPEFRRLSQARDKPASPSSTRGENPVASAAPPPVRHEGDRAQLASEAVAPQREQNSAPHAQPAETQPSSSVVMFTAALLAALGSAVLLLTAIRAGRRSKK